MSTNWLDGKHPDTKDAMALSELRGNEGKMPLMLSALARKQKAAELSRCCGRLMASSVQKLEETAFVRSEERLIQAVNYCPFFWMNNKPLFR